MIWDYTKAPYFHQCYFQFIIVTNVFPPVWILSEFTMVAKKKNMGVTNVFLIFSYLCISMNIKQE